MKFLDRFGIVGKIMSGYLTILCISIFALLFCLYSLSTNRNVDKQISQVYYPTLLYLKDVVSFSNESYTQTNNWVYQATPKVKERLSLLHTEEYPKMQAEINKITAKITTASEKETLNQISKELGQLIASEKLVMKKLNNDDAYGSDSIVDEAIEILKSKVTPDFKSLQNKLTQAVDLQNKQLADAVDDKDVAYRSIFGTIIISILIFAIIIGVATWFSINTIQKPVRELSEQILELSTGKFVAIRRKDTKDEIGQMANALIGMVDGLKQKADFADNIGNGQYESHFTLLSEDDKMGVALINMRNNLKKVAEDDKKRNWGTEGLAKFAEILRTNYSDHSQLFEHILSNLVKYMGVNQGALFIVNDEKENEISLEMVACYAYDRKKHLHNRVEIGEGLIGQAYLEKDTIFLTDVPQDYINITSGLGDANPSCVLIVPLKINDAIFGILELASFTVLEQHVVDFVEKLGESIASTISNSKTNMKTSKLLEQTQLQAEGMRSQEEEMRQNMEELQATQEEMMRKENTYLNQIQELTDKLKGLGANVG